MESNMWLYIVLPIAGGLILYYVISGLVRVPGTNLQTKFRNLGTLKGRTRSEIEAVVGPPNSVSATADGKTLCQWMATGYHVCLLFQEDVCDGVTHEASV